MRRLTKILGIVLGGFGITLIGALTLFTTMGLGVFLERHTAQFLNGRRSGSCATRDQSPRFVEIQQILLL